MQKETAKAKLTEICAGLEMATMGGDEKAVSCAQAGDTQPSQSNATMLLLGEDYSTPQQATDYPEAEMEIYMRDNLPSLDINPLDWWKVNEWRFPRLATLARRYLCLRLSLNLGLLLFS